MFEVKWFKWLNRLAEIEKALLTN